MSPGWDATPAPVPSLRAPTRFSWLGIALLGGAALIASVVTVGIFLPVLGELCRLRQGPAKLPDSSRRVTASGIVARP